MATGKRGIHAPEHLAWLRGHVKGTHFQALAYQFNQAFGINATLNQVRGACKRHGFSNGCDCRFKPGHTSFNKGKHFNCPGSKATQFKPGNRPWTALPVGTEVLNGDGYRQTKIAEPNQWRMNHLLVWEAAHGPIPDGYAVVFGDGNRDNVTLNNLVLVSRAELAVMNKRHLTGGSAEQTKAGQMVAAVLIKITERKREAKHAAKHRQPD